MRVSEWVDPVPVLVSDEVYACCQDQPFLAEALSRRGFTNLHQIQQYLDPDQYRPSNPADLDGMARAVEIIRQAIQNQNPIGVWGDFDVDGVTATTILVQCLREAGLPQVFFHIPHRIRDSHGIQLDTALKFINDNKLGVFVTCDTGVSAREEIKAIRDLGVKTIITDHHVLPPELPNADALINPRCLPTDHPCASLSGAGTAYMLARAITESMGFDATHYSDLAMIGTIADAVEIVKENRFIVQIGLKQFNSTPRIAWQSLQEQLNGKIKECNEEDIAFFIAPRLNAAGRLGDANFLVDFFLTTNPQDSNTIALRLEGLNAERRTLVEQVTRACDEIVSKDPHLLDQPILILKGKSWPGGVLGLSASRLVERYHKPTIVLSQNDQNNLRGSARSFGTFDIHAAISSYASELKSFGGHPGAAGLSLHEDRFVTFYRKIQKVALIQSPSAFVPKPLVIEAFLSLSNVNHTIFNQVRQLAPFGVGNPAPNFAVKSIQVEKKGFLDRAHEHAIYHLSDSEGNQRTMVRWNEMSDTRISRKSDLLFLLRMPLHSEEHPCLEWIADRPTEQEKYSLITNKPICHDFRLVIEPESMMDSLTEQYPSIQWWGVQSASRNILNPKTSNQLTICDYLGILTPPSDLKQIPKIIKQCHPKEVFLFNFPHPWDNAQAVLSRMGGLIKFTVKNKNGSTSLQNLQEALDQTERVVLLSLEWWRAAGEISISYDEPGKISFQFSGIKNIDHQNALYSDLESALIEVRATRRFYARADLDALFLE